MDCPDGTIVYADFPATVTFTPIDDSEIENDETIIVTLSNASGCDLGDPNTKTITITDNDGGGAPSGNGISAKYQSGAPSYEYQSGGVQVGE